MKMHYSISELYKMSLEILPSTERGIQIRVQKESWPFIEVAGKGGKNGKRREYAPPPDVMKQIQARKLEEALGGLADLPSPTEKEGKPAVRNEETALALPETVCIVDGSTEQQRLSGLPFRPEITTVLDVGTRRCMGWSVGMPAVFASGMTIWPSA